MNELAITLPDGGQVRKTADGRMSVYDLLKNSGAVNPRVTFKRLADFYPHLRDLVTPANFIRRDGKAANVPSPAIAPSDVALLKSHLKSTQTFAVLPSDARAIYLNRREHDFADNVEAMLGWRYPVARQYAVLSYRLDIYVPDLKLAIEFDEAGHKYQRAQDARREATISAELDCHFIRVDMGKEAVGMREIALFAFGPRPYPNNGLLTVDV